MAYDESFDPANLVSHEDVKKQHEQWKFVSTAEFSQNIDQLNIRALAHE